MQAIAITMQTFAVYELSGCSSIHEITLWYSLPVQLKIDIQIISHEAQLNKSSEIVCITYIAGLVSSNFLRSFYADKIITTAKDCKQKVHLVSD